MKKFFISFSLIVGLSISIFAQDITFVPRETVLTDTLGAEMIFFIDVTNVSQQDQTLFVVRTNNDLPEQWSSSLCFDLCFPPTVDSIATVQEYGSSPLTPGETREVALHVFPLENTGTGYVQLQAGTLRNSTNRITIDLSAIAQSIPQDDISVEVHRTSIDSTPGSEMIFDFEVINISQAEQTVFAVRTINDLPDDDWQSSLCFAENCFPPTLDSVATVQPFGDPLSPGDTLYASLHITSLETDGTANVQIQVGTFRNPTNRTTIDFTATAIINSVTGDNLSVDNYFLGQNYPNPFNPSTKITYGIKKAGNVDISVYNILGNKVATLFNGYKPAGNYSVTFDGLNLSSGVYFYKIISEGFVQTRKMILEK